MLRENGLEQHDNTLKLVLDRMKRLVWNIKELSTWSTYTALRARKLAILKKKH